MACLQNMNEKVPFDVYKEFGSKQMTDYVLIREKIILDYTNQNLLKLNI